LIISSIDRNKETKREELINKISSPCSILPTISRKIELYQNFRKSKISKGTILRFRDSRLMERRKTSHEVLEQERRIRDNRNNDSRWNIKNHHILVIALERNVGKPEPWKAGDNVLVLPKIKRSLKPKKNSAQNSSSNVLEKALEINCYI